MGLFSSITDAVSDFTSAVSNLAEAVGNLTDLAQNLFSLTPMGLIAEVASQVVQEFANMLPDQLGDVFMAAFGAATGNHQMMFENLADLVQAFSDAGASPTDVSNLDHGIRDLASQMASQFAGHDKAKGSSEEGESWLMALAEGMAKQINELKDEALELQKGLNKDDPGTAAKFNAKSQELNLMMTTAQNVIKTLGDGLATLARK